VHARHGDPFAVLGMHPDPASGFVCVRAFAPHASRVQVVDAADGVVAAELLALDPAGFFSGDVPGRRAAFRYRLRLTIGDASGEVEDAYRFGPVLGELDVHLIAEGNHFGLYDTLGAHPRAIDGVAGVAFAVWAPNAKRVSVVGDFNDWDGRRHPMRLRREAGIWEIFVPGAGLGARYKYEILGAAGAVLPLKADPYAFACERAPATASIVAEAGKQNWNDAAWLERRAAANRRDAPVSIYEVHLGSWKRAAENRYLTYAELADELLPHVAALGFTHVELLPVSEHPFDGSWGYQPIGLFAPTSRHGSPAEFADFVDRAHAAGIGVILDWVPGHFPTDAHGLAEFDGTHLYEHADPRRGFQPDWNTLVYNLGRTEVQNFLIDNALFWLERYHVDGLRVDAVASLLYLDYSREAGEWLPNRFGGRENLEAVAFLKRFNTLVYGACAGIATFAEESTAWPLVSRPVDEGGLGFGYKWNMGWMHDTLAFMRTDPLFRRFDADKFTFSFMYAFSENFVLPLSHDEVVHGKGSLLGKMPGDEWQRFANLRSYLGYMFAHPGKKLLFMGAEFAQVREWNHDRSLDWHLLADPNHAGVGRLVADLNRLYAAMPALHERDEEAEGLEWIVSDRDNSVVAIARHGRDPGDFVIAVSNFTPVVREGYALGVPRAGGYVEVLNTDDARYGGSGIRNGPLHAAAERTHDKPAALRLTLPPLATLVLAPERASAAPEPGPAA
jgi:1,4-alpha-glucan branching enzyme